MYNIGLQRYKTLESRGGSAMKKIIIIALVLLFTASTVTVFAGGGKNQGDTGTGTNTIGTDSQGSSTQDRTGR